MNKEQLYSPENPSTPPSPTVSNSPDQVESQESESKMDEIPTKVSECIVDLIKT